MLRCTGTGPAADRRPVGAAGERPHPAQALGRGLGNAELEEPFDRVAVELELVDRLAGADVAQLRRAVGGQHDQRDAGLVGLDHGRQQVRGGRAGGAGDGHRLAARLGGTEREEAGRALVDVRPGVQPRLAGERQHDRRVARAGAGAGVLHPAAHELVEQRADHQVAVGGGRGHDAGMENAPALVLLHGFTNSGASWQPVISGLGERYRALAPDIRGHASAGARRAGHAHRGDRRRRGSSTPEPFTLVGYSQGGRIALHVALALPHRVARLVLIGASPGLADEAEREQRRLADERLAEQIESLTIDEFARQWAQTPILADVPPEIAAMSHADRLRSTPAGLAAALRGLGTGALPSLWERLPELRMPVTLIAGERDTKFTALADEMARCIPRATVTVVPGAGHAVHLERPDAVVEALLRRTSRLAGRRAPDRRAPHLPARAPLGGFRRSNRSSVARPQCRSGFTTAAACSAAAIPSGPSSVEAMYTS